MASTDTADRSLAGSSYAIFTDSGRQFRARKGDEILVDRKDLQPGDAVAFEQVLFIRGDGGVKVGTPSVDGAKVSGEVVGHESGEKVIVFKYRRRKDSRRKQGHRAKYTRVRVNDIQG